MQTFDVHLVSVSSRSCHAYPNGLSFNHLLSCTFNYQTAPMPVKPPIPVSRWFRNCCGLVHTSWSQSPSQVVTNFAMHIIFRVPHAYTCCVHLYLYVSKYALTDIHVYFCPCPSSMLSTNSFYTLFSRSSASYDCCGGKIIQCTRKMFTTQRNFFLKKKPFAFTKNASYPTEVVQLVKIFGTPKFFGTSAKSSAHPKILLFSNKFYISPEKCFTPTKNLPAPKKNHRHWKNSWAPQKILQRNGKILHLPENFFGSDEKSLMTPPKSFKTPEKSFTTQKCFEQSRKILQYAKNW